MNQGWRINVLVFISSLDKKKSDCPLWFQNFVFFKFKIKLIRTHAPSSIISALRALTCN